uniref:Uncharacterized protein n=1 Tax=Rhizophora mucronata TaxID=61149 RepID=A0A2P2NGK2_RHIMU
MQACIKSSCFRLFPVYFELIILQLNRRVSSLMT